MSDDGPADPVRVVYVAGIGRSGSTLLDRVLGGCDGMRAVGELMHFFGRGLVRNEFCGCGEPVRSCGFWTRVADEVAPLDPSPRRMDRVRSRVMEGARMPWVFLPWRPPGLDEELRAYVGCLGRLYGAVARVAGGGAIVDSSKNLAYGHLLAQMPEVRLHVVHLVRDSRGVANSLKKRKERPGTRQGVTEYLDHRRPAVGAMLWSAANLLAERLRPRAETYLRVRYRDFVSAPARAVARVLRSAGKDPEDRELGHVDGRSVELGRHHLISGNPSRSSGGRIRLAEDLEWRESLSRAQQAGVTLLTLPLLARYGYL